MLAQRGWQPAAVVEPTCGTGQFLQSALQAFPHIQRALGVELQAKYAECARQRLAEATCPTEVVQADFFSTDWPAMFAALPGPILVIGNPPWVTNAGLGKLNSRNLPEKKNLHQWAGLAATTGKSNFDLAESICRTLLAAMQGQPGWLAMLCKTSVARKILLSQWHSCQASPDNSNSLLHSEIYRIDAARHFGATVDACLLVCEMGESPSVQVPQCGVFDGLGEKLPAATWGLVERRVVCDLPKFARWQHLLHGPDVPWRWRSGVKHDAASVLELRRTGTEVGSEFCNAAGWQGELEEEVVYPLGKSSDVAHHRFPTRRWLLLPQKFLAEDPVELSISAPLAWQYLQLHAAMLDRRASRVYQHRPRFSVFGVGPYTFAPAKVAVSGFYRNLRFVPVGLQQGRPMLFDDTCYFLPCQTFAEAEFLASLLNAPPAQTFLRSQIFPDSKRPVTLELLQSLNLSSLAVACQRGAEYEHWSALAIQAGKGIN